MEQAKEQCNKCGQWYPAQPLPFYYGILSLGFWVNLFKKKPKSHTC